MKKIMFFVFALPLLSMAQQQTKVYNLQPAKQIIGWTGYGEVGSYSLSGVLKLKSGRFDYDGKTLSNGIFVFDMNSISHENETLVKHLKDEDFFYVKKYPLAEFQLSAVKNGKAFGFVIIRNIKKPIEFPVSIVENAVKQLVIKGTLRIDRTQFEIYYNSNSFFQNLGSNAIKNEFDLKFELIAAAGS